LQSSLYNTRNKIKGTTCKFSRTLARAPHLERYASYKMNKIITSATILLFFLSCTEKYGFEIGEPIEVKVIHPVLIVENIDIPSTGKIIRIDGEGEIKKAKLNAYKRVVLGTEVDEDDILCLKKDTVVEIQFEDGSCLVNKPVREETYFTFEHINR
jgi:hypothetical protein